MAEFFLGLFSPFPGPGTWLALAVVMMVIEGLTLGLTTIWFAGGALAASVTALLTDSVFLQITVFAVISLVLVIFTRPVAAKRLNRNTVKTNADAIVGKECIALSDITKFKNGTVRAEGKEWTAAPTSDAGDISKGEVVVVDSIEGVKLLVRRA